MRLIEEFDKAYHERLIIRGWEKRTRITQLMRESAQITFDSLLGNSSKLIDSDSLELNDPWWVLEAKPGSGKTTMMIDVFIPVMTSILAKMKIFPIWILVNPASNKLRDQCYNLCQQMIKSDSGIELHDTDGAENIKKLISRLRQNSNYHQTSSGCVILTNQPMINAGYDKSKKKAKGCKPLIKKLLHIIVQNIKYSKKDKCDIFMAPLHDECRIASWLKDEAGRFTMKSSMKMNPSFIPAVIEFYNCVMSDIDYFTVIGFDGTPKFHMSGQAPKKKVGASLYRKEDQDNDYSKFIEYGGPDDIWKVRKMKYIPVSEDTLDESFYSGMVTKTLSDFYLLIKEAIRKITRINNINSFYAKKHNEELKEHEIQISTRKRLVLCPGGSDVNDGMNVKYERSKNIAKYLRESKHEHSVLTGEECYWMDSAGIKHHDGDMDEVENILDVEGNSQFLLLKKKRMTGWDESRCMIYIGTSEHSDMMPNHPTAKPVETSEQGVTRTVRLYTGFTDLEENSLSLRKMAKKIGELKKLGKYTLANDIRDLIIENNQFEVFYVDSSGYDSVKRIYKSDANGQLDAWLRRNYSSKDMFIKTIDEESSKIDDEPNIEMEVCPTCLGAGQVPCNSHFLSEEEQEKYVISNKAESHLNEVLGIEKDDKEPAILN